MSHEGFLSHVAEMGFVSPDPASGPTLVILLRASDGCLALDIDISFSSSFSLQ
ncbi:hypothetical protein U1Q18_041517, partial [Sarracenia purpurea var. burkii]